MASVIIPPIDSNIKSYYFIVKSKNCENEEDTSNDIVLTSDSEYFIKVKIYPSMIDSSRKNPDNINHIYPSFEQFYNNNGDNSDASDEITLPQRGDNRFSNLVNSIEILFKRLKNNQISVFRVILPYIDDKYYNIDFVKRLHNKINAFILRYLQQSPHEFEFRTA